MKLKIFPLITFIFMLVFNFHVYASEQVAGRVTNLDSNTSGSKVIYKDTNSQKEVSSQTTDPMGNYIISVPAAGIYDVEVVQPASEGAGKVIQSKKNQKVDSDSVNNIYLPGTPLSIVSILGIDIYVVIAFALALILFLTAGIFYLFKIKK